eukprot:TRINITY_DN3200_c0_g3_i2.p1 TRINITY_DN3200_c0_g3~~TRINITY_DN3200_c0_g3_i2.p1  ORF type:complete len:202 (-),score=48.96 TRINITY_DN3200_c0_g3_i2:255-860(-)
MALFNSARVLLIDNYDSFTYNIYQYLAELGAQVRVVRNDQITVDECLAHQPTHLVISPGPGHPTESGVSPQVVRAFEGKIPILGVCLGHQCMFELYGGTVSRSGEIVHGKTSKMLHSGQGIFRDIPNEFAATRYHSLVGVESTLPDVLEVTARTANGLIMAIKHKQFKLEGVQFHPESIMTEHGKQLLSNFLQYQGGTWDN